MVTISDAVVQKNTMMKCDELQISGLEVNCERGDLFRLCLEFSGAYKYYNASFFSRPLTRSLPPRDSADPDRRLNNP
ncbi:hypothetical protein CK493_24410 [Shigella sonnei]|nr:hypothetical protein CK493_24410 [Shigella sonnei]